ncbi:unnamed protein product [Plutella xylostella]|uniref:(diamondback moth) hypothetical protein n=1 Tax=Plutella xylostella TaxID=51655 RepID=A0A8S4E3U9_PLUXY|nr:unnamed protein product [Plutella xylostella]
MISNLLNLNAVKWLFNFTKHIYLLRMSWRQSRRTADRPAVKRTFPFLAFFLSDV